MKDERQNRHMEYSVDAAGYKNLIIGMVKQIDNTDKMFLMQIYTIIHRHIEKRGR